MATFAQVRLRDDRNRFRRASRWLLAILAVFALVACDAFVPSQTPPRSAGPVPLTPRWSEVIRIGLVNPGAKFVEARNPETDISVFDRIDPPWIGPAGYPLSNELARNNDLETHLVARFLFRALYRLDEELRPVPDLAEDYCDVDEAGTTWTCRLRPDVGFSSGDVVRARDVKFSFDLARASANPFGVDFYDFGTGGNALEAHVIGVEAVDPQTVRFTLAEPDPGFETEILPAIWIDPKSVLQEQFEEFLPRAAEVGAPALRSAAQNIATSLRGQDPDCPELIASGTRLLSDAGVELPRFSMYEFGPERAFDACRYAGEIVRDSLFIAASSVDATDPFQALARAYPILPQRLHPVGAGAWMINDATTKPGRLLTLVPSPGVKTPPATGTIEFQIFGSRRQAADAFIAGEIDWLPIPSRTGETQGGPELYRRVRDSGTARFVQHVEGGTEALYYNHREGRLFADRNLRLALRLCVDKPGIVEEATDGQGVAAEGSIALGHWASNPDLHPVLRDVSEGRRLIERSGWRPGQDGIYQKDGRRLSAEIWVGKVRPDRVAFAKLVAEQAQVCGMELKPHEAPFEVMGGFTAWPVRPTGERDPADLWVFGSLDSGVVGEPLFEEHAFESHHLTTEENPEGENTTGYSSDVVDELLSKIREAKVLSERANLYRREQAQLATDQAMLFGWQRLFRVAIRPGMRSLDGPLNLTAIGWDWQLERIVLPASGG
jgi:ABC-type transport system substrate-binding protein